MTQGLRVGLAQFPFGSDIETVVSAAAAREVDIVVFPEMFSNGYERYRSDDPGAREAWCANAESIEGDHVGRVREAARRHGIAVVATFLERSSGKPFNSAALIDRRGRIAVHQRKRHICFFDVPEDACAPGDASSVCTLETDGGEVRLGIMICMDREYPDVAADLARQGAEVVLIPNSCALVDDADVGDVRYAGTRARAFEMVMGMAVANYPVPKNDGHSFAVDPCGRTIAMGGTGPELVVADFDVSRIRDLQKTEWFRRPRQVSAKAS